MFGLDCRSISYLRMKAHEFDRIVSKLELQTRNTDHIHAWLEYDGKVVIRTKRSHGSKPQPRILIRQQLKLTEAQLIELVRCTLSRDAYIQILKDKGLI